MSVPWSLNSGLLTQPPVSTESGEVHTHLFRLLLGKGCGDFKGFPLAVSGSISGRLFPTRSGEEVLSKVVAICSDRSWPLYDHWTCNRFSRAPYIPIATDKCT